MEPLRWADDVTYSRGMEGGSLEYESQLGRGSEKCRNGRGMDGKRSEKKKEMDVVSNVGSKQGGGQHSVAKYVY